MADDVSLADAASASIKLQPLFNKSERKLSRTQAERTEEREALIVV